MEVAQGRGALVQASLEAVGVLQVIVLQVEERSVNAVKAVAGMVVAVVAGNLRLIKTANQPEHHTP